MFEKVEVPVLGIVENMSMHICSNCGHHEPIFGTGGAQKLAEKYHTQLLGQLPLHITLREDLDNGTPTVVARPDSEFTDIYRQLAGRVAAQMYWQGEVILVRLPSAPFKAAASALASICPRATRPVLRWSSHDVGRSAGRFYFPSGTSAFRWR